MKQLFSIVTCLIVVIIFLIITSGCINKVEQPDKQISSLPLPDTAKIEQALRSFEALPPATRGKAKILEAILNDARTIGYNEQACYLAMDLGRGQIDRGNFDSALLYYDQAKPYCYKPLFDKLLPAYYLTEFAAFYHGLQSNYVEANQLYYEALTYLQENNLDSNELTVSLYIFLHGTQEKLGHHGQALVYLKAGEKLATQLDSKQALAACWGFFGGYFEEQKKYDSALLFYDKALAMEEHIWDPNILTNPLIGKAGVLTETGRPAEAIPYLEKALEVSRKEVVIYSKVSATIGLGAAYNKLGRFQETVQLVPPALELQTKGFNTDKDEGYKVLMDAYEGLGKYKEALTYQRKLSAWQDSLTNLEKTSSLNEMELKFQTVNKDKEIASKELQIEQQKNKLTRKNTLIIVISAASLLTVMLLAFLYKNASHKQKVRELEINTLKSRQEIEILRSTMQGEEQERQRLSRELHDGIGSMISSAIMRLSLLKKESASVTPENIEDVLRLLQDTGSEIRKTAQNMMPDTLYKQSLFEAVKTYCDNITQGTPLEIGVQFYGVTGEFSAPCKLVVYRIIQELVHNIVKHANATHAIVQGVMNENRFSITVEDNGNGFDTGTDKKGMGLKNVRSRVKSLGGELHVHSEEGKGTTLDIEFDCEGVME